MACHSCSPQGSTRPGRRITMCHSGITVTRPRPPARVPPRAALRWRGAVRTEVAPSLGSLPGTGTRVQPHAGLVGAWRCRSRLPGLGAMGQANICGARGAAATQAQPGTPGPVAPGARRGLWRRAASRPPPPLGTFVSSGSPQLLLTLPVQVTRHQRTRQRHLLLFPHAVAIASFK